MNDEAINVLLRLERHFRVLAMIAEEQLNAYPNNMDVESALVMDLGDWLDSLAACDPELYRCHSTVIAGKRLLSAANKALAGSPRAVSREGNLKSKEWEQVREMARKVCKELGIA